MKLREEVSKKISISQLLTFFEIANFGSFNGR